MAVDQASAALMAKHAAGGLLIDTNLLLLLAVGNYDRRRTEAFKRTAAYTQRDFQRLGWIASQFRQLLTTPNILTEVDNLGRQLPSREWRGFAESLSKLSLRLTEEVVASSVAMKRTFYARLGLADTVTLSTSLRFLLLSDDFELYLAAQHAGLDAINFNHLRMYGT